jgi:2-succinyl-5-enolpyruvyl-6-hydroxy-3-cyclohexene-1-carboxylate synthase
MGMFFALATAKVTDIFPKDMPDKICADFTCKGRECTRENCSFKHPRSAKELQKETIVMIAKHFASKGVGWFNDWHFSQIDDLPAEVAPLMGGKDGPGKPSGTRKTA